MFRKGDLMQVRNAFGILAAVLALAGSACSSNNSSSPSSTTTPAPTTPSTPSTPATSGATTNVSIVAGAAGLTTNAYAPNPINIKVGDSVNWINNDTIAHTSTANTGATTTWSSGTMAPGASFKTTFNSAGSFQYHC